MRLFCGCLFQWFLNLSTQLIRTPWRACKSSPGPTSRDSDSVDLGWGLRLCISNKFPVEGDAATAGLRTPFEKHRLVPLSGGPSLAGGEEAVKLDPLLPSYPHSPPATDLPLPPKALFCSSFFYIHWPQAVNLASLGDEPAIWRCPCPETLASHSQRLVWGGTPALDGQTLRPECGSSGRDLKHQPPDIYAGVERSLMGNWRATQFLPPVRALCS